MKYLSCFVFIFFSITQVQSQTFERSELPTSLTYPWEIIFGPDDYLWVSEDGGKVSRVHPETGDKTIVYTAPDYFGGSPLENSILCPNLSIGAGTLGMALHPDFTDQESAFIYFVYSYNSGTSTSPSTQFRIKRLTWDANSNTVIADSNIVDNLTTGYDHLGGRLLAVKQGNIPYLYLSLGDNGRSEQSQPDCYSPQSDNPNNFTQDVNTQNGKIHRFNMDGSIPSDNPISGNSFYTRGHRNPQGLMYNPNLDLVYDIEHGDRTDDEINILYKGMNYGWKQVRGYHDDNSFIGEADYVVNYIPHTLIPNDSLVEPLYSWCTTPSSTDVWTDWCTVAPSGGVYYGSEAISEWTNSLLVVTLKDGVDTDKEVYQFKLQENGKLLPSTIEDPNPKRFFGEDQALNGRLRDIAISNDGSRIYLINNGGTSNDKITVYESESFGLTGNNKANITLYPNPVDNILKISGIDNLSKLKSVKISTVLGQVHQVHIDATSQIDVSHLKQGVHFVLFEYSDKMYIKKFVKK